MTFEKTGELAKMLLMNQAGRGSGMELKTSNG